jgi:hypothetical protein
MMPVLERQIAGMLRDHFEIVDGSTGSVTVLRLLIIGICATFVLYI